LRLSSKDVILDLVPFSEKVENHWSKWWPCFTLHFHWL